MKYSVFHICKFHYSVVGGKYKFFFDKFWLLLKEIQKLALTSLCSDLKNFVALLGIFHM